MSSRDGCQRALLGKRKSKLGVLRPGSGPGPTEDTGAFSLGRRAMRKSRVNIVTVTGNRQEPAGLCPFIVPHYPVCMQPQEKVGLADAALKVN